MNNNIVENKFNFFKYLRDSKSNLLYSEIKNFINKEFNEKYEDLKIEEFSCVLQEFILKLTNDFARIWSIDFKFINSNYIDIISGFENLICKCLYDKLIQMSLKDDKRFDKFCRKYIFLNLKHFKGLENVKLDKFELSNHLKSK